MLTLNKHVRPSSRTLRYAHRALCVSYDCARGNRTIRLLTWTDRDGLSLTDDLTENIPPYSILSHTWGLDGDEVTFADIQHRQAHSKAGYAKLQFCKDQARKDKIKHFWVDTCCINKDNHVELSEAITSMFQWYRNAARCYVYLSDVSTHRGGCSDAVDGRVKLERNLRASRWFTRGWTLQELLAPAAVQFYSQEGLFLGTKTTLAQQIHEITNIPLAALNGTPLSQFSINERMRWTEKRQTKKKEDRAYCLLGVFQVFMPLIYGEGENAFRRLQKEISEQFGRDVATDDKSVETNPLGLCLASAPLIEPKAFIGRGMEIDAIHDILHPDQALPEQRRAVLGGIGGIGKTQLAIAYARRYQRTYTSILWLNANTELTLYMSLRSIAQAFIAANELEKLDNTQILARFHEWLARPQNNQWLLIFDNYDDPDQFDLNRFCPNTSHGSIIVTTRLPDLVTGQQVRVRPLPTIEDALDVLRVRSGRENAKHDAGARRLVERLGGLPLALVTAGAYLRRSPATFEQYLDTYEQRWQVDHRRPLRLQDYQDRTLYTTWNMSYSRLQRDDPEAAQMLKLLAYFDHQEVWYDLLRAGFSDRNASQLPDSSVTPLPECLGNRMDFESVMGILVDYCFLEVNPSTQTYSLHNCVHDWTLGLLNVEIDPQLYWYAFDCLAAGITAENAADEMYTETTESFGHVRYARLSRHAARLTHPRFTTHRPLRFDLSERRQSALSVAQVLAEQGQMSAAERILVSVLVETRKLEGNYSNLAFMAIENLALLYASQGKLTKAERMYRPEMARAEKVAERDATLAPRVRCSLGMVCAAQGKLDEAEELCELGTAGLEETMGSHHKLTLFAKANLGLIYHKRGKFEKAETMYLQMLARSDEAFGPNQFMGHMIANNLGLLYHDLGRFSEALSLSQQAVAGLEQIYGCDHKSTLLAVSTLAYVYVAQGKLDEAEPLYIRVLSGQEKTLGREHPATIATVENLDNLYRARNGEVVEPQQWQIHL